MIDLLSNKYSMDELKKHIYEVNLWDILKTQKVDELFAVNYILSPKYQLSESEKTIDVQVVIYYQPHIKKEKLFFYLKNINLEEEDPDCIKFDEYI